MKFPVVVLTAEKKRIDYFLKAYNILGHETNQELIIIVDDTKLNPNTIDNPNNYSIILVSEIKNKCVKLFDNPNTVNKILEIYGVAIKYLIFVYLKNELGINKSLLIDDDTVLIKPLDHYFQFDYCLKMDKNNRVTDKKTLDLFVKIFGESIFGESILDINKNKDFISTGQMIFTYTDIYMTFLRQILNEDLLNYLLSSMHNDNVEPVCGAIKGVIWTIEQRLFSCFFFINKIHINVFGKDVKVIHSTIEFKQTEFDILKLPAFLHYARPNKNKFYDNFVEPLLEFIKKSH